MKKNLRILCALLMAGLLMTALAVFTGAEEEHGGVMASGSCGDNLTWILYNDGLLDISGEGAMWDFAEEYKQRPEWHSKYSKITSLRIGDGVTSIGDYAFNNYRNMGGSLIFPDSVTSIGDYAFSYCYGIGTLELPEKLTSIGSYAFEGCRLTCSLTIPDSVVTIGERAFGFNEFPGELTIPKSVRTIGEEAFYSCKALTGVHFSEGLVSIGEDAFSACSGLSGSVAIPDSVEDLSGQAFLQCFGLTGFELSPAHPKYSVYDGVVYTKDYRTVLMCPAGKTSLPEFHPSVREIGDYAFYYCNRIQEQLILPDALTRIGAYAFYMCGFKGDLKIPETVTEIGEYAFYFIRNLSGTVLIPGSVTSIGECAFSVCGGLDGFAVSETNPCFASYDGVLYSKDYRTLLICPSGISSLPEFHPAVGEIADYAFYNCVNAKVPVILPETIRSIGNHAFTSSAFTGLTIPNGVESIGEYAFFECRSIKGDLLIPGSVKTIGAHAFERCFGFDGTLTISDGVAAIEDSAFAYCRYFKGGLTIPGSVKTIGQDAFSYCERFDGELVLTNGIVEIGNSAFWGCTKFTGSLRFPESIARIENNAFRECTGFTGKIEFKDGIERIGQMVFQECRGIEGAVFHGNAPAEVESGTFNRCAEGFTVYCYAEYASGFLTGDYNSETKRWNGYPLEIIGEIGIVPTKSSGYGFFAENRLLTGVKAETSFEDFMNGFIEAELVLYDKSDNKLDASFDGMIGTGFRLAALNGDGDVIDEAVIVISGELDGDGKITAADRMLLTKMAADPAEYQENIAVNCAAELSGDGKVTALDRLILARALAGWTEYSQYIN